MTQLYNIGSSHPYRNRRRDTIADYLKTLQDEKVSNLKYNRLTFLVQHDTLKS